MIEGTFVFIPDKNLIGKVKSSSSDDCEIDLFFSLGRTQVEKLGCSYQGAVKSGMIERGVLTKETRAYVFKDNFPKIGRIVDYIQDQDNSIIYELRFNGGKSEDYNERDIFVRSWRSPQEDPSKNS